MEKILGTVERINYRNDETGFTIVALRTDAGVRYGVKGVIPQVRLGMTLECEGELSKHPRFGLQMEASTIRESVPRDIDGIEKYLASGLIDNIGPVYARKIVETFGEDTIRIMDNEPERLLEIKGIGKKRAESIIASAKEQKAIRDIMIWLKKYDLTNNMAAKIYLTYGNASIAKLEENPYRLADDLDGVGFKRADDVALRLGIPRDSPFRIHSGIRAALKDAEAHGHTFLPLEGLLHIASGRDFLSLPGDVVQTELSNKIEGVTVSPHGDVALDWLRKAETNLSDDLARLTAHPAEAVGCNLDEISSATGLNYSGGQRAAIMGALSSGMFVITGGPGTGKTSITNAIITAMRRTGMEVLLAAPTGRAAKRMAEVTGQPAKTIHRLLEYGREGFGRNENNPLVGDALIVDETSMMDTLLARSLLRAVPTGMRVIFVGDVDQLPPIGAGCVLRDIIDSGTIPTACLREIFRQAQDSDIIMNAHRINRGNMPSVRNDIFNGDMFFWDKEVREDAAATVIRLATTGVTKKFGFRPEDIQVLSPMRRPEDPIATASLNKEIQKILNPDGAVVAHVGSQELRVGDRIMQTRNNYDKGIFNGDMGVVTGKVPFGAEDKAVMTASFDGREIRLAQAELADVELAYACTVHKSQGMEYPVVIIPVHDSHYVMLKRNLLYTAVTRAKKLCILVGSKKAIATAVKREDTSVRYTRLKDNLLTRLPLIERDTPEEIQEPESHTMLVEDYGNLPKITAKERALLESYGVPEENIVEMEAYGETVINADINRARKEEYAGDPQKVHALFGLRKINGKMMQFRPQTGEAMSTTFEEGMRQQCYCLKAKTASSPEHSPVQQKKLS